VIEREDQHRFDLMADLNEDGSWITIACDRCQWTADIEDPITLAELNDRASEHTEVCR
jgi:hypothetical protein